MPSDARKVVGIDRKADKKTVWRALESLKDRGVLYLCPGKWQGRVPRSKDSYTAHSPHFYEFRTELREVPDL
jgi:hypothetical protein